jgi:zinc protease
MSALDIQIPYLPEKAQVKTYDNGFTAVFVPKQGEVFNISTWVQTGSINEDDVINGVSHFLEHLMFKGTKRFKPGEFDKAMESMGAVINAATWKDFTFYYITAPKGVSDRAQTGENFDLALDMHADMMLGSTIPVEEVGPPYDPFDPNYKGEKRERSVVIEEISMREDEPWTKVYNAVNSLMYKEGHPYRRDVIGTRAIIGSIPQDTICDYYHRWYSPSHMTSIIVGDFDPAVLDAKIAKAFDFQKHNRAIDAHPSPDLSEALLEPPTDTRYVEVKGDYQTAFFILGFHGPKAANLKESIALDVVSHVLGESRGSRLTQALLEKPKMPIFNYISSGQSTFKLGNVLFIQGNFNLATPDASPRQIVGQVERELERLLTTEPITAEEFSRALKKLKVDFAETSETASGIAEAVGEAVTVAGALGAYLDYPTVLSGLDVGTVNAIARKYLSLDKAYMAVMRPSGKVTDAGDSDDNGEEES